MVVNTVFDIGNGRAASASSRTRPTLVRVQPRDARSHEELVELRRRVNALSSDLKAATEALAAANDAIDRVHSENECLRTQIQALNEAKTGLGDATRAPGSNLSDLSGSEGDAEKKALNDVISALTEENEKLKSEIERLSAKKTQKTKKAKDPARQTTSGV